MRDRKLRWGVLGTANICRSVNPAIQSSRNGELLAVASRDASRASAFAGKWNIARSYGGYEALIEDADIDALYVPLPNGMHREWRVRALESGKHVLCEKPLALSEAECLAMHAAAEANDVTLMEAFMYRFHPRMERLVEMVRRGDIGELRAIRSVFTFRLTRPNDVRWQPGQGGGALMDVGCYCINAARTLAGSEPIQAEGWGRWHETGVDASVAGVLRFSNGLVAHFDCALDTERREFLEVAGTNATLSLDAAFVPGTSPAITTAYGAQRERTVYETPGADQYRLMVEHFADCALNGTPVRYPATEAAANLRVIEMLLQSARKRT